MTDQVKHKCAEVSISTSWKGIDNSQTQFDGTVARFVVSALELAEHDSENFKLHMYTRLKTNAIFVDLDDEARGKLSDTIESMDDTLLCRISTLREYRRMYGENSLISSDEVGELVQNINSILLEIANCCTGIIEAWDAQLEQPDEETKTYH